MFSPLQAKDPSCYWYTSFLASLLHSAYSTGLLLNSTTSCRLMFWKVSPLAYFFSYSIYFLFELSLLCLDDFTYMYLFAVYINIIEGLVWARSCSIFYDLGTCWWIRPLGSLDKGWGVKEEGRGEEKLRLRIFSWDLLYNIVSIINNSILYT